MKPDLNERVIVALLKFLAVTGTLLVVSQILRSW